MFQDQAETVLGRKAQEIGELREQVCLHAYLSIRMCMYDSVRSCILLNYSLVFVIVYQILAWMSLYIEDFDDFFRMK